MHSPIYEIDSIKSLDQFPGLQGKLTSKFPLLVSSIRGINQEVNYARDTQYTNICTRDDHLLRAIYISISFYQGSLYYAIRYLETKKLGGLTSKPAPGYTKEVTS